MKKTDIFSGNKLRFFSILLVCFIQSNLLFSQEEIKTDELFQMPLEEFMNISVFTSCKKDEKILETPAAVNTISAKEIKMLNFNTLEEVLEYATGISSVSGEGNFYTSSSIRGNTTVNYNVNTLLLFDGIPLYNPYNGSFELNTIPLNAIERIEIVKGANSVLYGSNAINAVINVISKKAKDSNEDSSIGIKYGTLESIYTQGSFIKNYEDVSIRLFADVNSNKGEDLTMKDELGHTETLQNYYKGVNVLTKIDYKDFSFHFQYYNRQQPNLKSRGFDYNLYVLDSDTFQIVAPEKHDEFGIISSLSYNHKFSEKTQLRISTNYWFWDLRKNEYAGYWDNISRSFYNEIELSIKPIRWMSNIIGVSSNNMFAQRYQSEKNIYDIGKDNRWTTDFSGYLNGTIEICKPLKVHYGARYYLSSYKDAILTNTSPRFAIVYNLYKNSYLKAIYGQSFRVPTYFEKEVSSAKIQGNSYLKPEKSTSIDLIYATLFKEIRFNIDLFYVEIQDQIGRHFIDPTNTISQNYNTEGKSTYTGAELNTKFRIKDKLTGFVGYSFVDGKNVQQDTTTTLKFTYQNMVNLGCNYQIFKRLAISSSMKYLDQWGEAESYILWNGGINFALTADSKCMLEFKVDNILGTNITVPEISRDKLEVLTIPITNMRKFFLGITCNF